ncbi:tetratricopeptide repeat protein [Caminibacter pacificus]|uniref:Tetratricopeptide repeat protein n=1 Tax=Caminibacter pacificus TaxID=1424653 RepID=A0AAJ4RDF5_9BACT|nr:tetratricopeptide repeat protein [Caminibacter pacificus]ROR40238.1 tetratricopeptide repeat protein [Caminibacter pacificus]
MKKGLFSLFVIFNLLFGYELIVKNEKDVKVLNDLGVKCEKTINGFVCAKSPDKMQLKRLQYYIKNNLGISSEIAGAKNLQPKNVSKEISKKRIVKNVVKTGYCIQVVSAKRSEGLLKIFEETKNLPLSRIEKIGPYFVLRVGEGKSEKELQTILKKTKKINKNAFIRKCDLIPQRIIKSNFNLKVEKKEKTKVPQGEVFNKTLSPEDKFKLMEKSFKEEKIDLAKRLSNQLKSSRSYKRDAFLVTVSVLMKKKKYKRVCNMLTQLSDFYKGNDLSVLREKSCFYYNYQKGIEYMNINPEMALEYLQKAEKYKSNNNLFFAKAIAYMNQNNYKKANDILKKLYQDTPDNTAVKLAYAKTLFNLGDFKTLEKIKDNNLAFFNHFELYLKAKKLYDEGKYKEANKIALQLFNYYPNNIKILLLNGDIFYKLGKYDLAYIYYKRVVKKEPYNIHALKGLRNLALANKDITSAVKISDILKNLKYKDKKFNEIMKEYYLFQADKLAQEGKFKEALSDVKEAEKYADSEKDIYLGYGKIYYKMGKYEKALDYYRMLYSRNAPLEIREKLIQIYIRLGKINKAKEIAQNSPNEIKAIYYMELAKYLMNQKKYPEANKYISTALEYNPINSMQAHEIKAWICYYLGDYECAKRYFEKSDLKLPEVRIGYAFVLAKLGNKNKAYLIAQGIKNESKNILLQKARLMIELGREKEAKEIFNSID